MNLGQALPQEPASCTNEGNVMRKRRERRGQGLRGGNDGIEGRCKRLFRCREQALRRCSRKSEYGLQIHLQRAYATPLS